MFKCQTASGASAYFTVPEGADPGSVVRRVPASELKGRVVPIWDLPEGHNVQGAQPSKGWDLSVGAIAVLAAGLILYFLWRRVVAKKAPPVTQFTGVVMNCPKCRKSLATLSSYCPNCGSAIGMVAKDVPHQSKDTISFGRTERRSTGFGVAAKVLLVLMGLAVISNLALGPGDNVAGLAGNTLGVAILRSIDYKKRGQSWLAGLSEGIGLGIGVWFLCVLIGLLLRYFIGS